jgi:hypothetical protein
VVGIHIIVEKSIVLIAVLGKQQNSDNQLGGIEFDLLTVRNHFIALKEKLPHNLQ